MNINVSTTKEFRKKEVKMVFLKGTMWGKQKERTRISSGAKNNDNRKLLQKSSGKQEKDCMF